MAFEVKQGEVSQEQWEEMKAIAKNKGLATKQGAYRSLPSTIPAALYLLAYGNKADRDLLSQTVIGPEMRVFEPVRFFVQNLVPLTVVA